MTGHYGELAERINHVHPSNVLHPHPEKLAAFALGKLDREEHSEVERHITDCESCCRLLRRVPDDTLLGRMQAINAATQVFTTLADPIAQAAAAGIPPELIDHPRYRIVRVMGAGGMGVVYQAQHRLMDRMVALKVVNRRLTSEPTAVERFRLEVKAAARLSHPNIVTVHDADQAGDLHFLVMEYVEGVSLARQVEKRGPLSPGHAANFVRQAALGLQHAWECGMVHRDIKPQNLMLTRKGQVKILDFGLARLHSETATGEMPTGSATGGAGITLDGVVLGTPDYIAPEQAANPRQADIRADIYSLGCTLYFLLAGQAPFARSSVSQKLTSHQEHAPRPLAELRSDLPPELVAIVERMMAKNPAARQQTPAEVAEALAPFARSASVRPIQAAVPTPPAGVPQVPIGPSGSHRGAWPGKRVALLGAGGLVVVAVCLLAGWRWGNGQPAEMSTDTTTKVPVPAPVQRVTQRPSVLMVVPPRDFYYPDVHTVRRQLPLFGVTCHIASTTPEECVPNAESRLVPEPIKPDLLISDARAADYDAIYFCGGQGIEVYVGDGQHAVQVRRLIQEALAAKCTLAAMGMGVVVLAEADVLRGRQAACYPYGKLEMYKQRIKARGAVCSEEAIVEDDPFLTGRAPQDLQALHPRVFEAVGHRGPAAAIFVRSGFTVSRFCTKAVNCAQRARMPVR